MNMTRLFLTFSLLLGSSIAAADVQRSTLDDQKQLAITIYNQDLALVKDRRAVRMNTGPVSLTFRDVSTNMRPETALLRSVTAPGSVRVIEQNFDQNVLTPQKLLERHVGKTVGIIRTNPATGAETREQAEVLSAQDGVVLKIGDRIETSAPGRIVFDSIPVGLSERPTLNLSLDNRGAQQQELELSYLTGGLAWKADYVAELNAADDRLDISGWFTITNASGTAYRNAALQLVAGDVNRARQGMTMAAMVRTDAKFASGSESVSQESFADYHLYTVGRPVTISENQTKQIALLSASDVPVRREWVVRGSDYFYRSAQGTTVQKMKIGMFIELNNSQDARLGMPLPKGILRIYKKDSRGNVQFVGEDNINHTPVNEKLRLKLGDAFDVTAQRQQTDFFKVPGNDKHENAFESTHEIVLKNAKKEAVTVKVQETVPGDWRILSESHPHKKESGNSAVWQIRVPAEGQATLTYRALVRY